MASANSINIEFRLVTKLVADLGIACNEAGITNPGALPEIMRFLKTFTGKDFYYKPSWATHYVCQTCSGKGLVMDTVQHGDNCHTEQAQALLKKAGVK